MACDPEQERPRASVRRSRRGTVARLCGTVFAAWFLAGCGGGETVPRPGMSFGAPPDLGSREVMVAPVQRISGLGSGVQPDAELAFALRERGPRVRWLFPDTLRRITERSPGIDVALERLPVEIFLRAEVRRVGDPLYGHLRRLNGLTGAPLILIPVRVRHRPPDEEVDGEVLGPAVEIAGALIEIRSGRVLWFGIVDGRTGAADDPRALASAADALARAVIR